MHTDSTNSKAMRPNGKGRMSEEAYQRKRQPRQPCKDCGGPKPAGRGRDYCDDCAVGVPADAANHKAYKRAWNAHNQEHLQARRLEKYERAKARIRAFKSSGCVDCGEMDIRCLQIDHIKGKTMKSAELLVCGDERREAELDLCEVRCANCHLRRHADADTFAEAGRYGNRLKLDKEGGE